VASIPRIATRPIVAPYMANKTEPYYERYAVREANKPLASISLKKNRFRIVKSVYAAI
jgi:hypothetical protein